MDDQDQEKEDTEMLKGDPARYTRDQNELASLKVNEAALKDSIRQRTEQPIAGAERVLANEKSRLRQIHGRMAEVRKSIREYLTKQKSQPTPPAAPNAPTV